MRSLNQMTESFTVSNDCFIGRLQLQDCLKKSMTNILEDQIIKTPKMTAYSSEQINEELVHDVSNVLDISKQ
jgi:hypothetical protein